MTRALSHIRTHGTFPVSFFSAIYSFYDSRQRSYVQFAHSQPSSQSHVLGMLSSNLRTNHPQPFVDSKEDQNTIGACPVSAGAISAAQSKVASWLAPGQPGHGILQQASGGPGLRVCVLDGFLLFSREMEGGGVPALLDAKLFLLVSRGRATQRRGRRDGYVTLEGFWTDPPGYVDKIVWPNYAEAHAWLFKDGDVEGSLDEDMLREKGILAQVGKGLDVDMETTFEWAVETLMKQLEELAGKR